MASFASVPAVAGCTLMLAACGGSGVGVSAAGASNGANTGAGLTFAKCMRAHGVPNWPDPVFPPGGGIEVGPPPGSTVKLSAPAVAQAQKVCGHP